MSFSPFGTFGEGYPVSYNPVVKVTKPSSSNRTKSTASTSSGGTIGVVGSSATATQTPAAAPIPTFTYTVKASNAILFRNTSLNAVSFLWQFFAAGQPVGGTEIGRSTLENPDRFYDLPGSYVVRLWAYNSDGATLSFVDTVVVVTLQPDCDFTYIISGTTVRFTDTSKYVEGDVFWRFGNIDWSAIDNPIHTFSGNGSYQVTLQKGSYSKVQTIVIDAEIVLQCDTVAGADGYKWERSANGVDGWAEIDDTVNAVANITEAGNGVDSTALNYFRVRAYDGVGDTDYSDITSVTC